MMATKTCSQIHAKKIVFNFAKISSSYGLKTSRKNEIENLFHLETYFDVLNIFHTGCLSAFKNLHGFYLQPVLLQISV